MSYYLNIFFYSPTSFSRYLEFLTPQWPVQNALGADLYWGLIRGKFVMGAKKMTDERTIWQHILTRLRLLDNVDIC